MGAEFIFCSLCFGSDFQTKGQSLGLKDCTPLREGRRVSSKSPLRVRDGNKGVAGRNGREKYFPGVGSLTLSDLTNFWQLVTSQISSNYHNDWYDVPNCFFQQKKQYREIMLCNDHWPYHVSLRNPGLLMEVRNRHHHIWIRHLRSSLPSITSTSRHRTGPTRWYQTWVLTLKNKRTYW